MNLIRKQSMANEHHYTLFYLFVFSIGVLQPVKIISLILSCGAKMEDPQENHLTTCHQNLACLTYDLS